VGTQGVGRELRITVADNINDADLRELIGLFHRYRVDKRQLKLFLNGTQCSVVSGQFHRLLAQRRLWVMSRTLIILALIAGLHIGLGRLFEIRTAERTRALATDALVVTFFETDATITEKLPPATFAHLKTFPNPPTTQIPVVVADELIAAPPSAMAITIPGPDELAPSRTPSKLAHDDSALGADAVHELCVHTRTAVPSRLCEEIASGTFADTPR
jgi:hypothetical protein